MNNITREQIEDIITFTKNAVIEAALVTDKDYEPYLIGVDTICALALRALDTPSTEKERDAWKSALQSLTAGGSEFTLPEACVEWVRMTKASQHDTIVKNIRRVKILEAEREAIEAKAYERAANLCNSMAVAEETNYGLVRGTQNLTRASRAIRALSPSTTRYVELPEGHVVVPAVADQKRIEIIESFIGDYTSRPIHGAARLYSALVEK